MVAPDAQDRTSGGCPDGAPSPLIDWLTEFGTATFRVDEEWRLTGGGKASVGGPLVPSADLTGEIVWRAFPELRRAAFCQVARRARRTETPVTYATTTRGRWYEVCVIPRVLGVRAVVRDVTDTREYHRRVTERTRRLRRLDRINSVIREVNRAIVTATTRDAIAQAACDVLTGAERYRVAVVADVRSETELTATAASGDDFGYLDAITSTDFEEYENGPVADAVRQASTQVVDDVETDERFPTVFREPALRAGLNSLCAIPLEYTGAVMGVLLIYSGERDGFTCGEAELLSELGDVLANAMHAADTRKHLFDSGKVRLELAQDEPADRNFLFTAAHELGVELIAERTVPLDQKSSLQYWIVRGASASKVLELVDDQAKTETSRVLGPTEEGEGERLELRVSGSTAANSVFALGGRIVGGEITDEGSRIVIELPAGGDVRAIVERVRSYYPSTNVRSVRRVDTSLPARGRAEDHAELLTDRQREVLELAVDEGYYEWPRGRSAAELAEDIGVAGATFHQHLRAAERKVFSALVDTTATEGVGDVVSEGKELVGADPNDAAADDSDEVSGEGTDNR